MSRSEGEGPQQREGVLFDLDGVLAATEPLKAEAHVAAVSGFGGRANPALYRAVMGRSFATVRDAFLGAAGVTADPAAYEAAFRAVYERLLNDRVEPMPGAGDLLRELTRRRFRLAVVSSSRRWMVDLILTRLAVRDAFHGSVSADDVREEKPAPDAYERALDLLSLPAARAVALEDTDAGVEAAARAGLRVLGVRHAFNGGHALEGAAAVLASLEDIEAALRTIEDLIR